MNTKNFLEKVKLKSRSTVTNAMIIAAFLQACTTNKDTPTPEAQQNITVYDKTTCKQVTITQSEYNANISKYSKDACVLPNKYEWHTYNWSEPFPIYMIEPQSFSSEVNAIWWKDSSLVSNFFKDYKMPLSWISLYNHLFKNWIEDFQTNPQILWTSIINEQDFQKWVWWDKINSLGAWATTNWKFFCDQIVLPEIIKKMKIYYNNNWYYPVWWTIVVNIPSSYYTPWGVWTIVNYTNTLNWQKINFNVIFSEQMPWFKVLTKDDQINYAIGTIFHELMHRLTIWKYTESVDKKIDWQWHDNNTYTAKYIDDNWKEQTTTLKSVFNMTNSWLNLWNTMNLLIKDWNPQLAIKIWGKYIDQSRVKSISRDWWQDIYIDDIISGMKESINNLKASYWTSNNISANGKFPRDGSISWWRIATNIDQWKIEIICTWETTWGEKTNKPQTFSQRMMTNFTNTKAKNSSN